MAMIQLLVPELLLEFDPDALRALSPRSSGKIEFARKVNDKVKIDGTSSSIRSSSLNADYYSARGGGGLVGSLEC